MMALWATVSASPLFRKTVVILSLVAAVLLTLAGFRRKAERTGRLIEREVHRAEAEKTRQRVEEVKKRMEEVPRPDRTDVVDKLRGGNF